MRRSRLHRRIAAAACILTALLLVPLFSSTAQAATWTREADKGITNANNLHLVPGEVFQGKLPIAPSGWIGIAAAPASMYMYDGSAFTQVGANGFGNPNIHGFHPSGVYGGTLYIGTANDIDGGELFTYDGVNPPVKVPLSANGWGIGATNDTTIPLGVVANKLVVSVSNRTGPTSGLRIYTLSGTTWTQEVGPDPGALMNSGFNNPNNHASAWASVYNGTMIIPVLNPVTGLEVWSYNGVTFSQIGSPGAATWPASQVAGMTSVSAVENALYMGTLDGGATGAQLWRWNGTTWTLIAGGGLGDPANAAVQPLVRGGDLYASTLNTVTGCIVYRWNGTGFTAVSQPGFNNSNSNAAAALANYKGEIVATTLNQAAGGEVWTTPALSSTWFFAEGTTRSNATDGTFEEWICLQNPNPGIAHVELTYMLGDGTTRLQNTTIDPNSRRTISVHEFLGPDKDVSTVVKSDQLILAERPMYFNYHNQWNGGHNVMGIPGPQTSWFFAEGTTRDNIWDGSYQPWLCLQNPGDTDATVDITYMLGSGQNVLKQYAVQKTSRKTVDVKLDVGANQDVSMMIQSSRPIVAERPMYFNYRNKWAGGHDVVGAATPATTFYFAEGTTRDNATDGSFEEWICIQNPGNADATVDITYWTANAGTQNQQVVVPKTSRSTVDVKLRLGANVDCSFKIQSNVPILVERPMYFTYHQQWPGGHNVMGCDSPRNTYYFAEGNTLSNFATYVAVLNPNTNTATVKFIFMIEGEANQEKTVTIPAAQRYTEHINAALPPDKNVSIKVESDIPVVAERPMYFNYHGWCLGGTDTLGYGI